MQYESETACPCCGETILCEFDAGYPEPDVGFGGRMDLERVDGNDDWRCRHCGHGLTDSQARSIEESAFHDFLRPEPECD